MVAVNLHGQLGKKFGKTYNLNVNSPKEAILALAYQKPGFKEYFYENEFYIQVGDDTNIDENTLSLVTERDINIYPKTYGARKGRGLGKLLVGAALFAFAGPLAWTVTGGYLSTAIVAKSIITNIAIGLALQGASALLTPQIKAPKSADENASSIFSSATPSENQGSAVPLLYGEMLVELTPISVEIAAESMNRNTGNSGYDFSVGGWQDVNISIS